MALFQIHMQEEMEISLWMRSVKQELKSNTHIKSSKYDFDFAKGNPSGRSKKFDWKYKKIEFLKDRKDLSTNPSLSTHKESISEMLNSSEFFLAIPEIEL